ncbi:metallophosphoesterase family protein [Paenibacillus protaetiae]|uniref:Metallophosphoesterase n=1 Tax=Paenibacillus protaetiae TaxID=2509456 RepID=A0A4P6EQR7_9BACL|nr:metallophosphoesterase family protein [Paenibacillus protaetiae]QAY65320.1 metallophosphoesterase [Paenibacillus protaetiae]
MQKIAIISDIHGNVPALEAVLRDVDLRRVDRLICLGDLIGKGPGSDVCVDLVRSHCDTVVMGNWDDFIATPSDIDVAVWHRSLLGEERLAYLASLPFSAEFVLSGKYVRLFHASPRSLYERIQPWDEAAKRLSLFEASERCQEWCAADVAGYGDIHNAYMQYMEGKLLFNAGSVGNPLDVPKASYVILEGQYGSGQDAPIDLQFVRVAYNIEEAVSQAEASGMPHLEPYVRELRTARYARS